MTTSNYGRTAGSLFLIIAVLHFLRLLNQWPANIGGWDVPMWLSATVVIVASYLALQGLKRGR